MIYFKNFVKAFLTPIKFGFNSGHFWSCLYGKSVDAKRNPIPMLTYPALEVLFSFDFENLSVLEFGSGQSSLFFSSRVQSLMSVESSKEWGNYVRKNTNSNTKLNVCTDKREFSSLKNKISDLYFDIVLIDGVPYPSGSRMDAANAVLNLKRKPKLIIVDNADLKESADIISAFEEADYLRADFIGYSPRAFYKQCTSFFFHSEDAYWALGNQIKPSGYSPYSN